jgi:nitroreductase
VLALAGVGATYFGIRQMGSPQEYRASVAATRAALSERPVMQDFIRYATLAASGHNTQPWRFRIVGERIEILPDFSRRTPIVEPNGHHLFRQSRLRLRESRPLPLRHEAAQAKSHSSRQGMAPWCSPSGSARKYFRPVRCDPAAPIDADRL